MKNCCLLHIYKINVKDICLFQREQVMVWRVKGYWRSAGGRQLQRHARERAHCCMILLRGGQWQQAPPPVYVRRRDEGRSERCSASVSAAAAASGHAARLPHQAVWAARPRRRPQCLPPSAIQPTALAGGETQVRPPTMLLPRAVHTVASRSVRKVDSHHSSGHAVPVVTS